MKTRIGFLSFFSGAAGITTTLLFLQLFDRKNSLSTPYLILAFFAGLTVSIIISVKVGKSAVNIEINALLDVRNMLKTFYKDNNLVYHEPSDYQIAHPVKFIFNELIKIDNSLVRLKKEIYKHERLFDNMKEGLIIIDNEGKVITINPAAKAFCNISEIAEGINIVEIIKDSKIISATLDMAEKKEQDSKELKITDKKGNSYYVFISRVDIGNDKTEGIILYIRNITSILKAERIRTDFTANVSHELKTPLTSIKGFTELLQADSSLSTDIQKKYLGLILVESERLISLINDILKISELESISIEEGKTQVNLAKIAEQAVEMLLPLAEKRNITLNLEFSQDCTVDANPSRLTELFLNLIENSIKYNKDNGSICVKIACLNNFAVITVTDTGIGIPQEDKDRVFERFYRVDKSRSKAYGGTGLGLSIVKHIVMLYKGSIDLKSELDKGTTIEIKLPKAIS